MPDLDYSAGWWRIAVAGAGTGLVLGPVSTDALNRAPSTSYGEATGITQTARNLGASLGLAVLGTLLIERTRVNTEDELAGEIGKPAADRIAESLTRASTGSSSEGGGGKGSEEVFEKVQLAFALSTETIFVAMGAAMLLAGIVALVFLPAGKAPELEING